MKRHMTILCTTIATFVCFPASAAKPSTIETVDVVIFGTEIAVGAAALIRTKQSATFRVNTTSLDPNSAYTIWIAAFNKPEDCDQPCDSPDIPAADGSVYFGSAFVTGAAGVANVEFQSIAGRIPDDAAVVGGHDKGIRRGNGFKVEIHLIVAAHGLSSSIVDWPTELSTPAQPFVQAALFK